MPSAIVFGATGQLGVAVAERLLALGWRVTVVSRNGRRPPATVMERGARLVDGAGRSRHRIIEEIGPTVDAVFDPTAYDEADALDLIAAQSRFGSLVVVSSSSVYADPDGRSLDEAASTGFPVFDAPITEGTTTVKSGPETYSTRKVGMELALMSSRLATAILRPCAVYGRYARHPREFWFIKRALDRRTAIPIAYGAESVFHTSSAQGVASLAALCMASPAARVLNVADSTVLSVREIARCLEQATGLPMPLHPFEGAPAGLSRVGGTPWSAPRPYVLNISRAEGLGWVADNYRECVKDVCDWLVDLAPTSDWRQLYTGFAGYGYDPFDYAAEDAVLQQLGSA